MLPPRRRLDPQGYYKSLGLRPAATRTDVVTAFRAKARLLHPDVPKTGNAGAFMAVKQAYDVLSNQDRRAAYDDAAREAALNKVAPHFVVPRRTARPAPTIVIENPRLFMVPAATWVGLAAFLCLCVYESVVHLRAPPLLVRDDIRPNAAIVLPLSPTAQKAVLYGPAPIRLAGSPNFYVAPGTSPATLWRLNQERNALIPWGQLPAFSAVQAAPAIDGNGMREILVDNRAKGFINANRLTPGSPAAARHAYCGYNAGPIPHDGELLDRQGFGSGSIEIESRAVQPAVVKLRDETGTVALSVYLAPGGHAVFEGLPEGTYYTEFAIGELWSRACNSFAAGTRARRMVDVLKAPGDSHIVIAPDAAEPAAGDIPDQAFERK